MSDAPERERLAAWCEKQAAWNKKFAVSVPDLAPPADDETAHLLAIASLLRSSSPTPTLTEDVQRRILGRLDDAQKIVAEGWRYFAGIEQCRKEYIEDVTALLSGSSLGGAQQTTWWLIERGQAENQSPTIWWIAGNRWTQDANDAARFRDRDCIAFAIMEMSGVPGVHQPFGRATEHVFVDRVEDSHSASGRTLTPEPSEEAIEAAVCASNIRDGFCADHDLARAMLSAAYAVDASGQEKNP